MESGFTCSFRKREAYDQMPQLHSHDGLCELYFLSSGERRYFILDSVMTVHAKGFVFIKAGVLHRTGYLGGGQHSRYYANVPSSWIEDLLPYLPKYYVCQKEEGLELLFSQLLQEAEGSDPFSAARCRSLVYEIVIRSWRSYQSSLVQDDGFPLRDELDAFLKYDYVGAPNVRPGWRGRVADALGLTVLNGGFSLRSRRVCRWAARAWRLRPGRGTPPEDRVYSPLRLLPWLRFPPAGVAARFSQDTLEGHLPFFDDLPPMGVHRAQTLRAALSPLPRLTVVSAVRDAACYRRCVRDNPHLRGARFVAFDNAARNLPVPVRYNAFVEAMPADTEWILFAHEDFEALEDPRPLLRTRPTWFPLGLIGTRFVGEALILPFGRVQDCARDGSGLRTVGGWRWVGRLLGDMVENFDCCGFFVHADLFRRLGLRFDPRCEWDLYAEDFCFQFILRTGHLARLLPLKARHWSRGDAASARFLATRDYLTGKYRRHGFAGGTCTLCVGQRFPFGFLTALRARCLLRRLLGRA